MARRSEKYDRAFAATRDLVNGHDPIGLINSGAPEDEYEPEVADLVRLVLGNAPITVGAVDEVWIRWFGETYRMSGTECLAALTNDLRDLRAGFEEK